MRIFLLSHVIFSKLLFFVDGPVLYYNKNHEEKKQKSRIEKRTYTMIHDIFELDAYKKGIYREETVTILFVLSGNLTIRLRERAWVLSARDLITLLPFEPFTVPAQTEDLHTLTLRIPLDMLQEIEASYRTTDLQCYLIGDTSEAGNEIKGIVAELFWNDVKGESGADIIIRSLLYRLLYQLMRNFGQKRTSALSVSSRSLDRVQKVTRYLQKHFQERLTLQSVAETMEITPGHLSRTFKETMSVSFSEYLTQIRLQEAVKKFRIETGKSITEIALDAGFTNINSFYVAFHRAFHMTPTEFRASLKKSKEQKLLSTEMQALLEYRTSSERVPRQEPSHSVQVISQTVDLQKKGTDFPHTWQKIINVGYAGEIISANVQQQLRIMQNSIGFTHLRFHGILDDDINIYNEDENGNPTLYFTYLDMILDFLDSINLKPYLELSFIPSKLAKNLHSPFAHRAYISDVKSLDKWRYLIRGIVMHCAERYGVAAMKQWYFSFVGFNWVQCKYVPDYAMSVEQYYELYLAAYQEIKRVCPEFIVGGPATDSFTLEQNNLVSLEKWLNVCVKRNCPPDFLAIHCYPVVGKDMIRPEMSHGKNNVMMISQTAFTSRSEDENYIQHHIKLLKQSMRRAGMPRIPILIDEWNSSLWQRDPISDTCFRSAFIAKNIMENASSVTAMAQAFVSDYSIEAYPEKEPFYGDIGLFTNNTVRKNAFYVYQLFAKLGTIRLASGDGWAIFRKDQTIQLVLYYYCGYNRLLGYTVTDFAKSDRYFVFAERENREYQFYLSGLNAGEYQLREWRINRENGSSYDKWVQMGSPENLTAEEILYLDRSSEPAYYKRKIRYENAPVSFMMQPHEVALIEMEPVI